jgi:hypothetical protein
MRCIYLNYTAEDGFFSHLPLREPQIQQQCQHTHTQTDRDHVTKVRLVTKSQIAKST